ncbi:hypothetical protein [unidentified bacterial endosymbiont]|uniref:hypothetical protein n=1 Tax=unidentified bacterial endosymbiont TaxID=2355 RepID=UPI00209D2BC0|nr:hypothetical protein [unidentified bacterial endosymbiont]
MEHREESNQNNQPNFTAAIENLQASVAKLQTLLTDLSRKKCALSLRCCFISHG